MPRRLVVVAAAVTLGLASNTAFAEDVSEGVSATVDSGVIAAAADHRQGLAEAFSGYGRPETKWAPAAVPEHESSGYTGDIPPMFLEVSAEAEVAASVASATGTGEAEEEAQLAQLREAAQLRDGSPTHLRTRARSGGRSLEMMGGGMGGMGGGMGGMGGGMGGMGGGMSGGMGGSSMGGGMGATNPAMQGAAAAAADPTVQLMQQQQMQDMADLTADDGRNPAAERIISDPDSFATELTERTKKVPHSWFGKGMFLAPTYQIATGREECDVCKALIENWLVGSIGFARFANPSVFALPHHRSCVAERRH